ncbi:MAG: lysostaphin resistance A-like protein [Arenimonas sp.]
MTSNDIDFANNGEINKQTPNIYKVLGAFVLDIGLLAVFWFLGMILATLVWTLNEYFSNGGLIANPQPGQFALMLISIPTLYVSILVLWALRGRHVILKQIPTPQKKLFLFAIAAGFLLFLLTTLSTYLLNAMGTPLQPSNQALLEDIGKRTPILITLFAITVAPFFEELLFRKQIFARFVCGGYVVAGYVISSLIFALMHEPVPTQGLTRWLLTLGLYSGMGALFAWIYRKSGKLWPAILAHASNNLFAMSALLISTTMS